MQGPAGAQGPIGPKVHYVTFSFVIVSNLYPHGIAKFLSDKWHIPVQHRDIGGNLSANVDLKKNFF